MIELVLFIMGWICVVGFAIIFPLVSGCIVSTVTYKDARGKVVEAASKEEMEEVVMSSKQLKISQAQNTPLMEEPLVSEAGWLGVGSVTRDILMFSYVASGAVSVFTFNLILGLARNDIAKLDNPDYNITPQMWTYYWK
jgi:hypothetical protein